MAKICESRKSVFNNPIILELILSHAKQDSLNVKLRLVNKTFNSICLKIIRKNHRKINIEFNEKSNRIKGVLNESLHVNRRLTKMTEVPGYFNFLKNVAKVRAVEVRIKNIWKLRADKEFHDNIHSNRINRESIKALIGLEEVCDGCSDCLEVARSCEEYGPIGFTFLRRFKYAASFKRLIITDKLLEQVAEHCTFNSSSKDKCYKLLNDTINSLISCETFVSWISESREIGTAVFQERLDHFFMPREVLEVMLTKWKSESVNIRFFFSFLYDFKHDHWIKIGYFTAIKLNSIKPIDKPAFKKFRSVSIDLTDSLFCSRVILCQNPVLPDYQGYNNLVINIRSVFQTDAITIKCLSARNPDISVFVKCFQNILNVVRLENQTNLTVNIQFFIYISLSDIWGTVVNRYHPDQKINFKFPEEFSIQPHRLQISHREISYNMFDGEFYLTTLMWNGKRLTSVYNAGKSILNVDVFTSSNLLEQQFANEFNFLKSFVRVFGNRIGEEQQFLESHLDQAESGKNGDDGIADQEDMEVDEEEYQQNEPMDISD